MKKIYLFITLVCFLINEQSLAQYTTLLNFAGEINGAIPRGGLLTDANFLYGMTTYGGDNNAGTVFKIEKDGTGYQKLLDFDAETYGSLPLGSLILIDDYLYGMTQQGGTNNLGTIFKIKTDGSDYVRLLNFAGISNGSYPNGNLFYDGTFLYGTTPAGGSFDSGILFKIKPNGNNFIKILTFNGEINGKFPEGPVISDGTFLYGITTSGGSFDLGTIFKVKPTGAGYEKLHDFMGGSDGSTPRSSLVANGSFLYGVTSLGGSSSIGTVFKISTDGTNYEKLYEFTSNENGINPIGSLITDGTYLYGMTVSGGTTGNGTVFRVMLDGTGFEKIVEFNGTTTGKRPGRSVISDGSYLYGMTTEGGSNDMGVVFKINKNTLSHNKIETEKVTVFPNPTEKEISFKTSIIGLQVVSIIDVLGQEIYKETIYLEQNSLITIDFSSYAKGLYLLKIGNSTERIIKK